MDKLSDTQILGAIMRAVRLRHPERPSQYVVAERAGLTREHVQRVERGDRSVNLRTLVALTDALEISLVEVAELFEESRKTGRLPKEVEDALTERKPGRPKKNREP